MMPINWPEGPPESTVYCRCGGIWRTHTKTDYATGVKMAKDPCPQCGKSDDFRRVSYDTERFVIGPGETLKQTGELLTMNEVSDRIEIRIQCPECKQVNKCNVEKDRVDLLKCFVCGAEMVKKIKE